MEPGLLHHWTMSPGKVACPADPRAVGAWTRRQGISPFFLWGKPESPKQAMEDHGGWHFFYIFAAGFCSAKLSQAFGTLTEQPETARRGFRPLLMGRGNSGPSGDDLLAPHRGRSLFSSADSRPLSSSEAQRYKHLTHEIPLWGCEGLLTTEVRRLCGSVWTKHAFQGNRWAIRVLPYCRFP